MNETKLKTADILHILRNPYGWDTNKIRLAQLQACDKIENWEEAYNNLREWCVKNGLDTATRNDI